MIFIGKKLRDLREAKGLSQRQLYKLSGIQEGHISQIETGKRNPGPEVVKKLCDALKIDEQYFYLEEAKLIHEVIPDLSEDLSKFIMNTKNTPYLVLSKKAQEQGISPEVLERLIDALVNHKS
jgi:transcriptional regulator with XRE-family HTH domain